MKSMGKLVRVKKAMPLERFHMLIEFEDGVKREIDLSPYLRGSIFKQVKEDPQFFQQVKIEGGTIVWPNGADIDPDVLYYGLKPAWMEELEQI